MFANLGSISLLSTFLTHTNTKYLHHAALGAPHPGVLVSFMLDVRACMSLRWLSQPWLWTAADSRRRLSPGCQQS